MNERPTHVTLSKAAEIAGIPASNLSTWRQRYLDLAGSEYFAGPATGRRSGQTDRTGVIFLAIVGRLTALGVPLPQACDAAWAFTDVGDWAFSAGGERQSSDRSIREPCQLYPAPALTYLAGTRWQTGAYFFKLIKVKPRDRFLAAVTHQEFAGSETLILIHLNALVGRVDRALASTAQGGTR